jgi:hypothetical protein
VWLSARSIRQLVGHACCRLSTTTRKPLASPVGRMTIMYARATKPSSSFQNGFEAAARELDIDFCELLRYTFAQQNMCGIFCSLSRTSHVSPDAHVLELLQRRGPDSTSCAQHTYSNTLITGRERQKSLPKLYIYGTITSRLAHCQSAITELGWLTYSLLEW